MVERRLISLAFSDKFCSIFRPINKECKGKSSTATELCASRLFLHVEWGCGTNLLFGSKASQFFQVIFGKVVTRGRQINSLLEYNSRLTVLSRLHESPPQVRQIEMIQGIKINRDPALLNSF